MDKTSNVSAGIGSINEKHLFKDQPESNMLIVRIGGPAYKIGLGGGFSLTNHRTLIILV